jgi:uncharacterized DUF497 family protein
MYGRLRLGRTQPRPHRAPSCDPREVEEVFDLDPDPVIVPAYTQDGENRFRAHGITARGRYLTVAYMERAERIRPLPLTP